jgi:tungstate transport system substrate-binding protein
VGSHAQERFITVSSTTSTEQSGLFGHLLPAFEKASGIKVRVVALGTGQALDMARRGDADVVFRARQGRRGEIHRRGLRRQAPGSDVQRLHRHRPEGRPGQGGRQGHPRRPAPHRGRSKAPFVSRGDKSGTHAAELRYWKAAGIDLEAKKGAWYRDTGSGMGPALNTAASMNAYILADRGTWLNFKNRGELGIVIEGDTRLFNQYGVILVNPAKHAHVKQADGQRFIDWVVGPKGSRPSHRLQDRR